MRIVEGSLKEVYPPSLYLTVHNLWREGFIVLLEDSKLVGFVAAIESGPKVARVLMLAVLPSHRRKAFGKMLMEDLYAACLAKCLDTVVLEVRKSNRDALVFYEREGFSVYGEIKNFYSDGEDAFKMMKTLEN